MEVAVIDWKSIDSRFVKDELFEHINAPQWVDLAAPIDPVDDEAWFCRPDCDHPKTVEDFFKERTPTPKRSGRVSEIPLLGERNRRDATLKKRGLAQQPLPPLNKDSRWDKIVEDSENQNPNFSTPNYKSSRFMKEAVKSSAEKKTVDDGFLHKEPTPSLRRTLSARNLFGGGEILNKITEFCNELKKLATRAKERENTESNSVLVNKQEDRGCSDNDLRDIDDKEKERTPLLEIAKAESAATEKSSNLQEKQRRKKRCGNAENTPISIDVNKTKHKEGHSLQQIRTCPPTPQCFSANRAPTDATPPKVFRSKTPERGILRELVQSDKEEKNDYDENKSNNQVRGKQAAIIAEKEARALDVFWFLKPCTLSS